MQFLIHTDFHNKEAVSKKHLFAMAVKGVLHSIFHIGRYANMSHID